MLLENLRSDIEAPPIKMRHLRIDRGFPVPWFVAWVDGKPEFRMADGAKLALALKKRLCWVCGGPLDKFMTFVIGPMCGINRTTSEPGCHRECALYSVKNCPFLSKPQMIRRENDLPEGGEIAGHMIRRNPGVSLLWRTAKMELFDDGRGRVLIQIGPPSGIEWWSQRRPARRAEVEESVRTGLPVLFGVAQQEGNGAVQELRQRASWLQTMYPKE